MTVDPDLLDRIVRGVLSELRSPEAKPSAPVVAPVRVVAPAKTPAAPQPIAIEGKVITEVELETLPKGGVIRVLPKAILTPSAKDVVRRLGLTVRRGGEAGAKTNTIAKALCLPVANTPTMQRLAEQLRSAGGWTITRSTTNTDAVQTAITELSRGGTDRVLILTDSPERVACEANRQRKVRAVANVSSRRLSEVMADFSPNLLCLGEGGEAVFALKRMLEQFRIAPKTPADRKE